MNYPQQQQYNQQGSQFGFQQPQQSYGFGGNNFNKQYGMNNQQSQSQFGFNSPIPQQQYQNMQNQPYGQQQMYPQQQFQPMQQQFKSFNKPMQEQLVYAAKYQQQNGYILVQINGVINFMDQQNNIKQLQNLNRLILSADLQDQILILGTESGMFAYNLQFNQIIQLDQQYNGVVSKVQYVYQSIVCASIVSMSYTQQLDLANPKQNQQSQSLWGSSNNVQLQPIPKYKLVFYNTQSGSEIKCTSISSSYPSNGLFYYKDNYLLIPQNPNYVSQLFEMYKLTCSNTSVSANKITNNVPESQLSQITKDFILTGCCFNVEQKVVYICGSNGQIIVLKNVSFNSSYSGGYSYYNKNYYNGNSSVQVTVQNLQAPILSCIDYISDVCLLGLQNGQIIAINQQLNTQILQQTQIPVSYLNLDKSQMNGTLLLAAVGEFQQQTQKGLVVCQIQGNLINQIQLY